MSGMIERIERMVEAIERAAGLVARARAVGGPYEMIAVEDAQKRLKDASRSALAAVREPTQAMIDAGDLADRSSRDIWRAMIDEALK